MSESAAVDGGIIKCWGDGTGTGKILIGNWGDIMNTQSLCVEKGGMRIGQLLLMPMQLHVVGDVKVSGSISGDITGNAFVNGYAISTNYYRCKNIWKW